MGGRAHLDAKPDGRRQKKRGMDATADQPCRLRFGKPNSEWIVHRWLFKSTIGVKSGRPVVLRVQPLEELTCCSGGVFARGFVHANWNVLEE